MLREALSYIVGLGNNAEKVQVLEICGETYANKRLERKLCAELLIRSVWEEEREPCWKTRMGTVSLTGSVVSVF